MDAVQPSKPVTIDIAVGIIGKYFSKTFAKHNIEERIHVTGIYPLNGNIFDEDKFHHPVLLTELAAGNRTSQCALKLQGQQGRSNNIRMYREQENMP